MDSVSIQDLVGNYQVEAMWAAEQARRAACPADYRDAQCEACGCSLFVPVGEARDILCPRCQREGEALAALEDGNGDDDPTPPAGAALDAFASYTDDNLILAVNLIDLGRV